MLFASNDTEMLQKWSDEKCDFFFNTSDWSKLLSPWRFKTFPAMCGSPSETLSTGSHREASVHRLYGARAADIKTLLMFLSGNLWMFSNIITHVGTNDVCLRLSAIIRCSIIFMFHNALKRCEQSIFSAASKWECRLLAASLFFERKKITDFLHVVPTRNWTSRVGQKHSCSPPTQSAGWTWTLITHRLCTSHIFLSFLRPQTHESVPVSIATCLVPPSFDVVSSPPVLYCLLFSVGEMAPLLPNNPRLLIFVSVTSILFLTTTRQHGQTRQIYCFGMT